MRVVNAESRMSNLGHAFYKIMPTAAYYSQHPDWYSGTVSGNDNWQLCLTNTEMRKQFVNNVIAYLEANPNINNISLGQNDGDGHCTCSACMAKYSEYGSISGLNVEFCNYVAEEVYYWAEVMAPERADKLQFYFIAYAYDYDAPIKNGQATIKCDDNVGVMIAPIASHVSKPYTDSSNYSPKTFPNWEKVTDNFYIWSYSIHYADYMMPHNVFASMQQNIGMYIDMSTEFVFDQAQCSSVIPNFDALKTYLFSQLLWDNSQDMDVLIGNFINAYYGNKGCSEIKKFYTAMADQFAVIEAKGEYSYCAYQLATTVKASNFSFDFLKECEQYFTDALTANEQLKSIDKKAYEEYKKRIEFESLDVLYLQIKLYESRYSTTEYNAMVSKFNTIASNNGATGLL